MSDEPRSEDRPSVRRIPTTEGTREGVDRPVNKAILPSSGTAPSQGQRDGPGRAITGRDDPEEQVGAATSLLRHVTHEIRTPLTAIVGYAQLLEDADLDPKQREALTRIQAAGEHALSLVDDILDLARATSGQLTLDDEPVDVASVTQAAIGMLTQTAEEKGLALEHTIDADVPSTIRTDATHLEQVLVNLLSNAVKATEEGRVHVHVERVAAGINGHEGTIHLRFQVEDTGTGIPEDQRDELFVPFSQIPATEDQDGSGLGLAISKELVTLMGGSFDVHSTVGEGSTFSFTIRTREALVEAPA